MALTVSLVPTLMGCDLGACNLQFVQGIEVEMRPGFAEPPTDIAATINLAFGFVRDGSYLDSLRVGFWTGTSDSTESILLQAAGERAGVYDITVQRSGFQTWDTTHVRVRDDGCHVNTTRLQVTLRPAP